MVKAIQCYEDAAGKLHKCPFDAHRADLALWFARSESINETSAKQLADRIANTPNELDELIEALKSLRDSQPERPIVAKQAA
jgi:hypothetical protein